MLIVLLLALPLAFVSTGCYIRIYRIVRHYQFQIHAQQQAVDRLKKFHNHFYILHRDATVLYSTPLFISTIILCISQIHLTKAWRLVHTVKFMNSAVTESIFVLLASSRSSSSSWKDNDANFL